MRAVLPILALAASASAATISIAVGQNGDLKFDPDTVTAAVGDTLEFHFYSGTGGHSVVSSELTTPCQPATDAFFSGYIPGNDSGDETFVVNVTSTDPIWYYCSLSGHCQEGMVGVVNPPSGKTATDYANAAEVAGPASAPSSPQGGSLTTLSGSAASSSSGGISTNTNARLSSSTSSGSASATPSSVSGIGTNTGERLSSTLSESASTTMPTTTTGMATNTNTREPTGASSAASSSATAKSSAGIGRKERSDVGAAMGLAVFAGGLVALMA